MPRSTTAWRTDITVSARSPASIPTRRPTLTRPLRSSIDNWRWAGVPFYIRSGKKLPKRVTDIAIRSTTRRIAFFIREWQSFRSQSADPADSTRGRNFAAFSVETTGQRHAAEAGLDGLQLRLQFRRAFTHGL